MKNLKLKLRDRASGGQIEEFQKRNNITLPMKYQAFLHFSDGIEVDTPDSIKFYGIASPTPIKPNAISVGSFLFTIIGKLSDSELVLVTNESQKIFVYNLKTKTIPAERIYNNFSDFLENLKDILHISSDTIEKINEIYEKQIRK